MPRRLHELAKRNEIFLSRLLLLSNLMQYSLWSPSNLCLKSHSKSHHAPSAAELENLLQWEHLRGRLRLAQSFDLFWNVVQTNYEKKKIDLKPCRWYTIMCECACGERERDSAPMINNILNCSYKDYAKWVYMICVWQMRSLATAFAGT